MPCSSLMQHQSGHREASRDSSELRGREVLAASDVLFCPGCLSLAEYLGVNIVLCTLN